MPLIDRAHPLWLASASPRRQALLEAVGLPIRVAPVEVDESAFEGESPREYVERVVALKLGAAAAGRAPEGARAVLVADTIVTIDGHILGKPVDAADARALLGRIVGRTHRVLTRYAIGSAPRFAPSAASRTVETDVIMRRATAVEIERYVATGEGMDKAGAYAVQGVGAFLVERLVGSYTNVVGLPVCEVIQDLGGLGLLGPFP